MKHCKRNRRSQFLVFVTLFLLFGGCGDNSRLKVAKATGTVALDGKPLTDGVVIFTPTSGRGATGVIGSDGTFSLSTYGESDGATIGIHNVSIVPALDDKEVLESEEPIDANPQIPTKYFNPASSGLKQEVKAGDENHFDFELVSDQ